MSAVYKYIVTNSVALPNKKLLLENDIIYVSNSYYVMNGSYAYARDVYNKDKNHLGMIRDDFFWDRLNNRIKRVIEQNTNETTTNN